jgi:hypothetical protein
MVVTAKRPRSRSRGQAEGDLGPLHDWRPPTESGGRALWETSSSKKSEAEIQIMEFHDPNSEEGKFWLAVANLILAVSGAAIAVIFSSR